MSSEGDGKDPKGSGGNPFGLGGAEERELEPDLPPMRAVAITSLPPSLRTSSNVVEKPSWHAGPPLGLSKPAPYSKRRDSLSMKKEWSGKVAIPASWKVKAECLEMVPEDFPLERTHREIHNSDASDVADRISSALRKLSIQAEYDGEKAKVKCQTRDLVDFRIRMYAGGEGGQPVIVEVQRRSGAAMSFMQSCRAILSAAEGKEVSGPPKSKAPFSKMPVADMKCLQMVMKRRDFEKEAKDALERVIELMESEQLDSKLLGLENLCALTDPIKTAPKCATITAKAVVLETGGLSVRPIISATFVSCTEQSEVQDSKERGENVHAKLRQLILKAFSSSLLLSAQAGCLAGAVKGESWFRMILIPLLLGEIKEAATRPNDAYVCTCSLTSLMSCSLDALDCIMENEGKKVLEGAHEAGMQLHELLAKETRRCLDKLQDKL